MPGHHTIDADAHGLLKKHFGYDAFRPRQLSIIQHVVAGEDAFVLMPTGSGKSICYQLPGMMRNGVGVVVSPLIALMQDQVAGLRQNGIRAAFLNSSLTVAAAGQVESLVAAGEVDLLYVAPERLFTDRFQSLLERIPLALFAIDEAHCVSQWGHDFRPEYIRIREITDRFRGVPRMALTATADAVTRRDIVEKLGLVTAKSFISSFDRPNIHYRVQIKADGKGQLYRFIHDEHGGDSGIVYVRTRKRADDTSVWLMRKGIPAMSYHAGLDAAERADRQKKFIEEPGRVMVATIAFGMGIDKPDVRFVAHLDLPASMEAYYQETGRAGRDGDPADAWLLYSLADIVAMRKLQESSEAGEEFRRIQQKKLAALFGFCEMVECRRQAILTYFGESHGGNCRNCDNCGNTVETYDGTVLAQKALSCVYRTGQRFGAHHLADVLMGRQTDKTSRFGHDRIKTFGVGNELDKREWISVYRQLLAAGFLSVNPSEISGFRLTEESWPVLRGERSIRLRKDAIFKRTLRKKTVKEKKTPEEIPADLLPLWEELRNLRMAISKEQELPPYCIFHDATLKEMVVTRPKDKDDLLMIHGIGESKAARYGEQFLAVLDEWCDA